MKTDIADRWIAALRSGEYEQSHDQLRGTYGSGGFSFCCLGVLCDLHSKETGTPWGTPAAPGANKYMGASLGTPLEVARWAGMPRNGHLSTLVGGVNHLATLNDNRCTFAQIADVIEAQKETL